MKIALVSQEYPPETARGGIGSQTYTKAKGLSSFGHQVFVISQSPDGGRHEIMDGHVCIIRVPEMENYFEEMTDIVYWLTRSVVVAAEIEKLNKRVGLDLIDFPEWAAEGYTYLLNRTRQERVPVVIQLHGPLVMFGNALGWPEMNSEFYRAGIHMEAMSIQMADAIYSSSECSASWIRNYYSPKKQEIPVIHLGVDTKNFAPQSVCKNGFPTIVFVGKIVRNKGVEELVEATALLAKRFPDIKLRLIGKGDKNWIRYLQDKAKKLGAPNLLDLPGFFSKEDLPVELSKAHVFAAPSWYEGGPGFVYLEAMSCGLPVIGCSGSGVEEIVTHGKNGLLVPPKDVKALQQALSNMLNDESNLQKMGANARSYVLNEADSESCLRKLEMFYYSNVKQAEPEPEQVLYD